MDLKHYHRWNVSVAEARDIQSRLAGLVIPTGYAAGARLIAGSDISGKGRSGATRAAVVVLSYPELKPVDVAVSEGHASFPYVPGLLSFREIPLLAAAFEKLKMTPDLVMVDGQGVAHPRRFGLAAHLGVLLDLPAIGCAKSRLCGEHTGPDEAAGSWSELAHDGEVIGAVLRTRDGGTPLYVSVGHLIGLDSAVRWVMQCCRGYRLPEPTRLAHLAAGGASI